MGSASITQSIGRVRSSPCRLILHGRLCPGDELTRTAAIESLHRTFPGEYITDVRSNHPAVWESNPLVTPIADADADQVIDCNYTAAVDASNQRPRGFIEGYTQHLGEQLGVDLPCVVNRPVVHLSPAEIGWLDQVSEHHTNGRRVPFWLIASGTKNDFTAKQWPVEHYQQLVNETRGRIQWVQVGESRDEHPPLDGVIDLVGKTDLRQLLRLCFHAAGGVGPVTMFQHGLAAFAKPYICILGGREPAQWVQYPQQITLHSIGSLDCCRSDACWRSRVVPIGDGDSKDSSICENPRVGGVRPFAVCMGSIGPGEVIAAVSRFSG